MRWRILLIFRLGGKRARFVCSFEGGGCGSVRRIVRGVVALLMLALLEREPARAWDDLEGLCRFVEVTRRAYVWRDRFLGGCDGGLAGVCQSGGE